MSVKRVFMSRVNDHNLFAEKHQFSVLESAEPRVIKYTIKPEYILQSFNTPLILSIHGHGESLTSCLLPIERLHLKFLSANIFECVKEIASWPCQQVGRAYHGRLLRQVASFIIRSPRAFDEKQ